MKSKAQRAASAGPRRAATARWVSLLACLAAGASAAAPASGAVAGAQPEPDGGTDLPLVEGADAPEGVDVCVDCVPPLAPGFAPLTLPLSLIAPGTGHVLRGNTHLAKRLYAIGGAALGGLVASFVMQQLSGSADATSAVAVPLGVASLSTFLATGLVDWVGTYSADGLALPRELRADAPFSPGGLSLQFLAAPRPQVNQRYGVLTLAGEWRGERVRVGGWVASQLNGESGWLGAHVGVVLWRYTEELRQAGLGLELGVQQELNRNLGYDATRVRLLVTHAMPLGLLGAHLGRFALLLRLGFDVTVARLQSNGHLDVEPAVAGGFELRWSALRWLRPFVGYEHARDGLHGGIAVGQLGAFTGGAEVLLPYGLVLAARGYISTPVSGALSMEKRW